MHKVSKRILMLLRLSVVMLCWFNKKKRTTQLINESCKVYSLYFVEVNQCFLFINVNQSGQTSQRIIKISH